MRTILISFSFCCIVTCIHGQTNNYRVYHQKVMRFEQLIAEKKISEARQSIDSLIKKFDFVFLREYKLATELSVYEQDDNSAFEFLRLGILGGWSIKNIKKTKSLKRLQSDPRWKDLEADYDSLRMVYRAKLNMPLRIEAHEAV